MDEEMAGFAITEAIRGLGTASTEQNVANMIKNSFEKKYKSTWHCIVGKFT